MVTKKRTRLDPKKVEMLVVTKENRGKVEDFKADFGDQWNDDDKENKSL